MAVLITDKFSKEVFLNVPLHVQNTAPKITIEEGISDRIYMLQNVSFNFNGVKDIFVDPIYQCSMGYSKFTT